jgi:hypothetical protein
MRWLENTEELDALRLEHHNHGPGFSDFSDFSPSAKEESKIQKYAITRDGVRRLFLFSASGQEIKNHLYKKKSKKHFAS